MAGKLGHGRGTSRAKAQRWAEQGRPPTSEQQMITAWSVRAEGTKAERTGQQRAEEQDTAAQWVSRKRSASQS